MNKKILSIITIATMVATMLPITSNANGTLLTLEQLREQKEFGTYYERI